MAALGCTHLLFLGRVGGFHYDEAWAALFSHRIASEPGFWPFAAMSPYSSAWSHYVAALFFKIFGTSLFVYRLSGIVLVMAGVSLMSLALKRAGQARAAAFLPWVIAFFSAAVINHRFAIEINTFHVFCLGLLCWGLSQRISGAVLLGTLLGITSHVLFLAPALSCLILAFWNDAFLKGKRERAVTAVALVLLAGFFLRIHLGIPEKDKSFFLLLIATLSFSGVVFPSILARALQKIRAVADAPIRYAFLAAIFVAGSFLLFFSEGSWAAAFFNGGQSSLRVATLPLIALVIAFVASARSVRALALHDPKWKWVFAWIALTTILTAAMATKPAPRYFEIPFLLLACLFALALAHTPRRIAAVALLIWIIGGAAQLQANYFGPALAGNVPERSFRFLVFRDNSSDTLLKQDLAHVLAESGCRFEQVTSDDIRILEPLRFLSLGDWNAVGTCRFGSRVRVQRKSQLNPRQHEVTDLEAGPFVLYRPEAP